MVIERDIGRALEFLHRNGYVHGRVAEDYILVDKVTDNDDECNDNDNNNVDNDDDDHHVDAVTNHHDDINEDEHDNESVIVYLMVSIDILFIVL